MSYKCAVYFVLVIMLSSGWGWSQQSTQDQHAVIVPKDNRFHEGKILYEDNFEDGLKNWQMEAQKPGKVSASGGVLDIDVPAGLTLWFKRKLDGPVMISYEATVISAGGPNDRVSDLNCFWMATDPASPQDMLAHRRSGAFAAYNDLLTYYVGVGGRGNTTTRFRRYIGDPKVRPLLPQNDLSGADKMIAPNRTETIRVIADDHLIEFYRGQERLFEYIDPHPYEQGWFGIRTTQNHMQVRNFRVVQLIPR